MQAHRGTGSPTPVSSYTDLRPATECIIRRQDSEDGIFCHSYPTPIPLITALLDLANLHTGPPDKDRETKPAGIFVSKEAFSRQRTASSRDAGARSCKRHVAFPPQRKMRLRQVDSRQVGKCVSN